MINPANEVAVWQRGTITRNLNNKAGACLTLRDNLMRNPDNKALTPVLPEESVIPNSRFRPNYHNQYV